MKICKKEKFRSLYKFIAVVLIQALMVLNCLPANALSEKEVTVQVQEKQCSTLAPLLRLDTANIQNIFSALQDDDPRGGRGQRPQGRNVSQWTSANASSKLLTGLMIAGIGIGIAGMSSRLSAAEIPRDSKPPAAFVQDGQQQRKAAANFYVAQTPTAQPRERSATESVRQQRFNAYAQQLRDEVDNYFKGLIEREKRRAGVDYFERRDGDLTLKVADSGGKYRLSSEQYLAGEDQWDESLRRMPERRLQALDNVIDQVCANITLDDLPSYIRKKAEKAGDLRDRVIKTYLWVYAYAHNYYVLLEENDVRVRWASIAARGTVEGNKFGGQIATDGGTLLINRKLPYTIMDASTLLHEGKHWLRQDLPRGYLEFYWKSLGWIFEPFRFGAPSYEKPSFQLEKEFFKSFHLDVAVEFLGVGYLSSKWISAVFSLCSWMITFMFLGIPYAISKRILRRKGITDSPVVYIGRKIGSGVSRARRIRWREMLTAALTGRRYKEPMPDRKVTVTRTKTGYLHLKFHRPADKPLIMPHTVPSEVSDLVNQAI